MQNIYIYNIKILKNKKVLYSKCIYIYIYFYKRIDKTYFLENDPLEIHYINHNS